MPIYSLADLRASAPPDLRDAPDAELLQKYAESTGQNVMQVAEALGVSTGRNRNAFMAGLSSGVDDLQGLGYSAGAAAADAVGLTGARDWLNRRANANQIESAINGRPDLEQVENVWDQPGKWLPYAAYQVAKQVPNLAGGLVAGAVVPEAAVPAALVRGAAIMPRALGGGGLAARVAEAAATGGSEFAARRAALDAGQTFADQIVGGGAFNYGQSVGSLYQAASDGGNDHAGAASLVGGVPYAITETAPEAMLMGRIGHGAGFTGALPARLAKAGLTQGAAGATSELLQNEMEMAYQGNVTPDQALSKRLNSGIAGALVEGIMGLPGGIKGNQRMPLKSLDHGSTDLLAGREPLELSSYAPTDGPAYAPNPDQATPRTALVMPGQYDLFNPNGTPTYAADRSFSDTNPLRPFSPDYTTSPGAAPAYGGIPFTRDIDTGNLSLAPRLDDGRTIDMFTGEPTSAPAAPTPQLELMPSDASIARQLDLNLQQQAPQPQLPATPTATQRGITGQLPFSANTKSPKGQVLQGLVDSLHEEGHLDDGTHAQVSTLIARGRFGDAKAPIDEAIKNKTAADALVEKAAKLQEKANDADQSRAADQRAGDAAGSGPVQRDGGVSDAANLQQPGGARVAAGADAHRAEAAPAVPADTEHSSALEGVTTEALTQVADEAKDIRQYESALDEMYRRWRDDGDEVAAKYFEDNKHVPGFAADLARVRERAGEKPTAPTGQEGKRGLKLGRHPQGDLAPEAKETDSILRGLATPKFRTREAEDAAPVQTHVSDADLDAMLQDVQRAVPGAQIEIHDNPEAAGVKGPPGGDTPMGVTMSDGRVLLFRQGLADRLEAARTAFHELFHRGLAQLLPEAEYHRMMDKLYAADPQVQQRAHAWGHTPEAQARKDAGMTNRQLRSLAIEEALAEMAEDLKTQKPSTIRALAQWFAQVADRLGLKPLAQWLRSAGLSDAQKFIEQALQANTGEPQQVNAESKFKVKNSPADDNVAKGFATFPGSKSTIGQKIQDALFNLRESPWALKWITNDQIAEGYKHLKPVQDINRATMRMGSVANRYLETAAQTAKKWRALADDVQLAMQKVMLRSTMEQAHVSIKQDGKYLGVDQAWAHSMNDHLDRSNPAVKRTFYELYREFNALPPAAKAVYDTVRDDLTRQHDDTLKALRRSVADQYATQLSRSLTDEELTALANSPAGVKAVFKDTLMQTGTRQEIRALEQMYQSLRDLNSDFGTVRGPYFPLVRFGDHVVVMKAKDVTDLEQSAAGVRAQLQQALDNAPAVADENAEAHNAKVTELRSQYQRLQEKLAELKNDDRKYIVEFYESPAQAERARQALADKYPGADVYRSVREQYYRGLDGTSPGFLNQLTDTLAAALDAGDGVSAEAKTSAIQAMRDLYLQRQPERSALRSELKRMNIEGVQAAQMLRGYAQASRNGAWRISRLLHSGEVTQGLQALSEDRRSADAKHVLNELKARFVGDLVPPAHNQWLQRLGNATYFMHLGFNLSYFLTNSTQAWCISLPVMGGRHGIINSANSLMAASKDVIKLLANATAKSIEENGAVVGLQLRLTDEQIASLAKDAGEAQMLKALTDDGVVDITIKHDLGAISDGTSKSIPGRVMEVSSALANFPELYNRLTTALAAYRMEMARREGGAETPAQVQQRAQDYAEHIINRTHFNYSPENAPRVMRGQLGRLVFQFKRYQQGMVYLFAKLIRDSSNGDADARRSLGYLLGATTAVSGVAGLPIAAPIALAAKVLASTYPDDDEPDWLQQWYNGMKDGIGETAAQSLVKGLPAMAGLDLSKKLGQGDLLNPAAFANTQGKAFFSRDYWTELGFGLMGPGAALLAQEAQAVGYAKEGNFLKAAEAGMPTFVANALRAFDRADQGITTKHGDTIMTPEEFNVLATVAKAAGLESVKVTDTYDNRSSFMDAIEARKQARFSLLRDYYDAVKSGDSEAIDKAHQAINAFNQRQPTDRVKPADLASAIRTHAQHAAQMRNGIRVDRRNIGAYNRLMGQE